MLRALKKKVMRAILHVLVRDQYIEKTLMEFSQFPVLQEIDPYVIIKILLLKNIYRQEMYTVKKKRKSLQQV